MKHGGAGRRCAPIGRCLRGLQRDQAILPLERAILVNMRNTSLHIDNQGRMRLPSWWRREQGVDPSTELCVAITEEGALVVETREQGLRRARALLRKYIPEGVNLSDELIAERRAEAARESEQRQ